MARKKKSRVKLDTAALAKSMLAYAVEEQNRRFLEYAAITIQEIGDTIKLYHSRNHMDRTGNLLDSLCWGLSYRGKLIGSGFYREQTATRLSYLHEWFYDQTEPVGGHVLANNFIKQMANLGYSGWRLFFAILAPYWGYWEAGFNFKARGKFLRFAVMTQFYDKIAEELKPTKVKLNVYVPQYTLSSWNKKGNKRDERASRGGHDVYGKYPRGKGKGKYDY